MGRRTERLPILLLVVLVIILAFLFPACGESVSLITNPTISLVSPVNNAVGQETTVNLIWNATVGTPGSPRSRDTVLSYKVYFSENDVDYSDPENPDPSDNKVLAKTGLKNSTTYKWKVEVVQTDGKSAISPEWRFTTKALPVPTISNPVPNNGTVKVDKQIEFSWDINPNGSNVSFYDFYLGTEIGNMQKMNHTPLLESSFRPETLEYNTRYYWKVKATITESGKREQEIESSVWNFKTINTLEIHVIASQDDMDKGYFYIEFWENPKAVVHRYYDFYDNFPLQDVITLISKANYLEGSVDESNTIEYLTDANGVNSYGFRLKPIENQSGNSSGYCDARVAVWDMYYTFPIFNADLWDNVLVFFDTPEGMPVYAPWEKYQDEEMVYQISPSPYERPYIFDYQFWTCAWGYFEQTFIRNHYDTKNLILLSYKTDASTMFEFADFMFTYMMQAFENSLQLMPRNTIIAMFNSDSKYYGGEGVGGYYLPNWMGDTKEPIFDPNAKKTIKLDSAITLAYPNIGGLSTTAGHCILHTGLTAWVDDWWPMEGIATYYQLYLFLLKGWFTQEMFEAGWKLHIDFYHDYVIPNDLDYSLWKIGSVPLDSEIQDRVTWIAYIKGALIFYIIDQIIRETTGTELIDYMKVYIEGITGENQNRIFSYNWFIDSLSSYTGKDFRIFFDKYIFDKQTLPIRVINDSIVIDDWEAFSEPSFVRVNSGTFMMGDEYGDLRDECSPSHQVTLTYDFLIGKYPVTFDEYDDFCEATGRDKPNDGWELTQHWGRGTRPVINICFWDIIAFCNWLSDQKGYARAYDASGKLLNDFGQVTTEIKVVEGYRLLTEAEWEYAASGGHLASNPRYKYSGSNNIDEVAWYQENSDVDNEGRRTQQVGQKKPNELGIYDMSGNVWEWVNDWWTNSPYPEGATVDPIGPLNEVFFEKEGSLVSGRVNRGGTWKDTNQHSRIAMREWDPLDRVYAATGFRIGRTLF